MREFMHSGGRVAHEFRMIRARRAAELSDLFGSRCEEIFGWLVVVGGCLPWPNQVNGNAAPRAIDLVMRKSNDQPLVFCPALNEHGKQTVIAPGHLPRRMLQ